MNIKSELNAILDRMLGGGLPDRVLSSFLREIQIDDDIEEREFREGSAALHPLLTDGQRAALAELNRLNWENFVYGLRFGFLKGIRAGTSGKNTEEDFEEQMEPLLRMPALGKQPVFGPRNQRIRDIEDSLYEALSEADSEHLTSVTLGWDERIYGAMRHGFFLGCCLALEAASPDTPLPEQTVRTIERRLTFPEGWFSLDG